MVVEPALQFGAAGEHGSLLAVQFTLDLEQRNTSSSPHFTPQWSGGWKNVFAKAVENGAAIKKAVGQNHPFSAIGVR